MSSGLLIVSAEDDFGSFAEFGVDGVFLEAPIGVEVEDEEKVSSFVDEDLVFFVLAANVLVVISQDVVFDVEIDHQFIEIVEIKVL